MIYFSVAVFITKVPTVLYVSQYGVADTQPSPQ